MQNKHDVKATINSNIAATNEMNCKVVGKNSLKCRLHNRKRNKRAAPFLSKVYYSKKTI